MQRIIVDLPEPDGPMTTTTSVRATLRSMSVERLERAEALVDALHLDDHVAGRGDLSGVGEDGCSRFAHRSPTPNVRSRRWLSRAS